MKKLKLYLETSVWNFYFADDAPEKKEATIQFFEQVKKGKYEIYLSGYLMIKDKEPKSLLEVREWKEKCRLHDRHLPHSEYIKRVKEITEQLMQNYKVNLNPLPSLSPTTLESA